MIKVRCEQFIWGRLLDSSGAPVNGRTPRWQAVAWSNGMQRSIAEAIGHQHFSIGELPSKLPQNYCGTKTAWVYEDLVVFGIHLPSSVAEQGRTTFLQSHYLVVPLKTYVVAKAPFWCFWDALPKDIPLLSRENEHALEPIDVPIRLPVTAYPPLTEFAALGDQDQIWTLITFLAQQERATKLIIAEDDPWGQDLQATLRFLTCLLPTDVRTHLSIVIGSLTLNSRARLSVPYAVGGSNSNAGVLWRRGRKLQLLSDDIVVGATGYGEFLAAYARLYQQPMRTVAEQIEALECTPSADLQQILAATAAALFATLVPPLAVTTPLDTLDRLVTLARSWPELFFGPGSPVDIDMVPLALHACLAFPSEQESLDWLAVQTILFLPAQTVAKILRQVASDRGLQAAFSLMRAWNNQPRQGPVAKALQSAYADVCRKQLAIGIGDLQLSLDLLIEQGPYLSATSKHDLWSEIAERYGKSNETVTRIRNAAPIEISKLLHFDIRGLSGDILAAEWTRRLQQCQSVKDVVEQVRLLKDGSFSLLDRDRCLELARSVLLTYPGINASSLVLRDLLPVDERESPDEVVVPVGYQTPIEPEAPREAPQDNARSTQLLEEMLYQSNDLETDGTTNGQPTLPLVSAETTPETMIDDVMSQLLIEQPITQEAKSETGERSLFKRLRRVMDGLFQHKNRETP